jgi:hypothetical protein
MVKINQKEKEFLRKFSDEYILIHGEILRIEKEMGNLQKRSKYLIETLEDCRRREDEYMQSLEDKYGEGCVNPVTLCWEKEIKENEISK